MDLADWASVSLLFSAITLPFSSTTSYCIVNSKSAVSVLFLTKPSRVNNSTSNWTSAETNLLSLVRANLESLVYTSKSLLSCVLTFTPTLNLSVLSTSLTLNVGKNTFKNHFLVVSLFSKPFTEVKHKNGTSTKLIY